MGSTASDTKVLSKGTASAGTVSTGAVSTGATSLQPLGPRSASEPQRTVEINGFMVCADHSKCVCHPFVRKGITKEALYKDAIKVPRTIAALRLCRATSDEQAKFMAFGTYQEIELQFEPWMCTLTFVSFNPKTAVFTLKDGNGSQYEYEYNYSYSYEVQLPSR